jgi:hypothetical protein
MLLAGDILVVSSTPFVSYAMSQQGHDEMAQGVSPWTMSHAGRIRTTCCGSRRRGGNTLLAKPEPSDRRAVPLDVFAGQVRQKSAPLSHELEKAAPGVKVVLVLAEVISEPVDPLRKERNLNLGRTGIIRVRAKLGNNRLFLLALQRHSCASLSGRTRLQTQKNRAHLSTQPAEYSIREETRSPVRAHRSGAGTLTSSIEGTSLTC